MLMSWGSYAAYLERFGGCCGSRHTHIVNGAEYVVWADFNLRGCVALAGDGVVRQISSAGYVSKDLSVRKAIAAAFGLSSFRK